MKGPQQAQVKIEPIKKCNKEESPNVREKKSGTYVTVYLFYEK